MNRLVPLIALALLFCPRLAQSGELQTNVYLVPPTFLSGPPSLHWEEEAPVEDPFGGKLVPESRPTAKEILENAGITFGPGSSAIYDPSTSQLMVRNTRDQIDLVEAYIDAITVVPKQVYLTFREILVGDAELESTGWEWLGVAETGDHGIPGSRTRVFSSMDDFRKEFARKPAPPSPDVTAAGAPRVLGVFTDPQFQVVIRTLNQSEGVDMLVAPSLMTRSAQPAMSQVNLRRYGVVATIGADEYTLDLRFFLPEQGKALVEEWSETFPASQVTIWDGQTVAFGQRTEDERNRIVFVTAKLLDPAGLTINEQVEAPVSPENALFPPKVEASPVEWGDDEKEKVKKADELALKGARLADEGALREALDAYEEALRILPENELTEQRRRAFAKQLKRARERAGATGSGKLDRLLRKTIIPSIDFREQSLEDCLGVLLAELKRHGGENVDAKVRLEADRGTAKTEITLRLSNVPMAEALRYTCDLSRCQFRVEGNTIVVSPLGNP